MRSITERCGWRRCGLGSSEGMSRAIVIGCMVGLAAPANADESRARDHAQSSATLYLASTWSPSPTVPIRIGVDGAFRMHHNRLALEARVGLGGAGSVTAIGMQMAGHLGASVGFALTAGDRVVLSPMLAYDVFALWEHEGATVTVHYATIELPVAIVLDRGVVLEALAQLGLARYQGATDPAVVIGPRIGIVF